jgi:hypothetical protein
MRARACVCVCVCVCVWSVFNCRTCLTCVNCERKPAARRIPIRASVTGLLPQIQLQLQKSHTIYTTFKSTFSLAVYFQTSYKYLHSNLRPRLLKSQRARKFSELRRHFNNCERSASGGRIWKLEWHALQTLSSKTHSTAFILLPFAFRFMSNVTSPVIGGQLARMEKTTNMQNVVSGTTYVLTWLREGNFLLQVYWLLRRQFVRTKRLKNC